MAKRVRVTEESSTGRNLRFQDGKGGDMSRAQFVKAIRAGEYPDYHVRVVHGVATPASNPDNSEANNLG
jgi:hypothetical protein